MTNHSGSMAWMNLLQIDEDNSDASVRLPQYQVTVDLNNIDAGSATRILQKSGAQPDQYELSGRDNETAVPGLTSEYNLNTSTLQVHTTDKGAYDTFISALSTSRAQYKFKIT